MNFNIQQIVATSRQLVTDVFDRQISIEASLALYLAQSSPLPASAVTSPNVFYIQQVKSLINARLNLFNEAHVINLDRVEDMARAFWTMRYYAAFVPLLNPETKSGFVDGLVRADVLLDEETHAFLNKNKAAIFRLYNQMTTEAVVLLVQQHA